LLLFRHTKSEQKSIVRHARNLVRTLDAASSMSFSKTQTWDPAQYAQNARFVSDLGKAVVDLLAPQAGERILDLGCGDGALSVKLVEYGCEVIGIDTSPGMVAAAKSLGLNAHVKDGEALDFNSEFDAVFSNAALHWMKKPERVIAGVWRALKPGGRFVGEFGGQGNVAAIKSALEAALAARGITAPNPWFYPSAEEYQRLLAAQGFSVNSIALFPRPTPLPSDIGAWLETFAQAYLALIPETERQGFIHEQVERLRPALCDANGLWLADYVRLRFSAYKPKSDAV
jgi:trans-aconitate methyltransferase